MVLKKHHTLLHWIEQERSTIDDEDTTLVKEGDRGNRDVALEAVRRASPSISRQKKQRKGPTILGKVRISEAKRRKPNTPPQKRKTPKFEASMDTLESSFPHRGSKPRGTRTETPLTQLHTQRVSKIKGLKDANTKSPRSAKQHRSPDLSRSNSRWSPQRLQHSLADVKTWSERLSRRPEMWR